MKMLLCCALVFAWSSAGQAPAEDVKPAIKIVQPEEDLAELVEVVELIPNIAIELAYATERNFFKHRFYKSNRCFLRRGVVEKLALVQKDLNDQGLGLKIWDGYRPRSVQWEFWKVVPDPRYVADPREGSRHNRGAAVDLTLIDLKTGQELPMPTGFDDFTPRAAADFALLPAAILRNRSKLREAMVKQGFIPMPSEWWHFDAEGWEKYPLMDIEIDETRKPAAK